VAYGVCSVLVFIILKNTKQSCSDRVKGETNDETDEKDDGGIEKGGSRER